MTKNITQGLRFFRCLVFLIIGVTCSSGHASESSSAVLPDEFHVRRTFSDMPKEMERKQRDIELSNIFAQTEVDLPALDPRAGAKYLSPGILRTSGFFFSLINRQPTVNPRVSISDITLLSKERFKIAYRFLENNYILENRDAKENHWICDSVDNQHGFLSPSIVFEALIKNIVAIRLKTTLVSNDHGQPCIRFGLAASRYDQGVPFLDIFEKSRAHIENTFHHDKAHLDLALAEYNRQKKVIFPHFLLKLWAVLHKSSGGFQSAAVLHKSN